MDQASPRSAATLNRLAWNSEVLLSGFLLKQGSSPSRAATGHSPSLAVEDYKVPLCLSSSPNFFLGPS